MADQFVTGIQWLEPTFPSPTYPDDVLALADPCAGSLGV